MRLYSAAARAATSVTRSVVFLFLPTTRTAQAHAVSRAVNAHLRSGGSPAIAWNTWTHANDMELGHAQAMRLADVRGNGVVRHGSARASRETLLALDNESSDGEQLASASASCSNLSTSSSCESQASSSSASSRSSLRSLWSSPKFPSVSGLKRMVGRDVKGKGRDAGPPTSSLAALSHLAWDSIARLWNAFKFDPQNVYEPCMELARKASEEQLRKRGAPGESSTSAIAFKSAHSHLSLIAQARLYSEWVRWHNSCA